ncbi:MAG TPA: MaoC family dehydratase N-terminal domain-containing protein [Albitalea sp.]|nr:MaoC family dehydratase N-terminal domain-containing protein [Albitalea sp.]
MNEFAHLKDWLGRVDEADDVLDRRPAVALSATLDRDDAPPAIGDPLPPLWHWLYFLPAQRQSAIGPDGHPKRGGFLPPVALPRRMWAGGRFEFIQPLRIGEAVKRTSRIADISAKQGRSGALVFVRVRHEIANERGVALTEEHDIVYRDPPAPGAAAEPAKPAPGGEQFARTITPDPVLLFRYSALTFNGHRIHYDRSYVTEVEGYPGLVVHGPLIATLLVDLLRRERPDARLTAFEFRAVSPLFDTAPFTVCGRFDDPRHVSLWALGPQGQLTMQASATIA